MVITKPRLIHIMRVRNRELHGGIYGHVLAYRTQVLNGIETNAGAAYYDSLIKDIRLLEFTASRPEDIPV